MFKDLHFYIDLNWEYFIDHQNDYLKQTYELVKIIYQHKATVFYSNLQINDFKEICHHDNNFMRSVGNKLELLLENANPINNHAHYFEVCFANENSSLNYKRSTSISSIIAHSKLALISFSEEEQVQNLLNVKSNFEFEKIQLHIINNKSNLINWIVEKSKERVFNKSSKHGENGIGNWPSESVLLCNKERAQELLMTAIPDFREKGRRLFAFDENHLTFIEFYYEGDNPQNQWHGFHLRETEWIKRVPLNVRKYYKKQ